MPFSAPPIISNTEALDAIDVAASWKYKLFKLLENNLISKNYAIIPQLPKWIAYDKSLPSASPWDIHQTMLSISIQYKK